jgi:hypothetical protein
MSRFVKPAFFACLALSCLAVGSGAQQPVPPVPQPPPVAAFGGQNVGGRTFYYPSSDGQAPQAFFVQGHDLSDVVAAQLAKQLVDAKTDTENSTTVRSGTKRS